MRNILLVGCGGTVLLIACSFEVVTPMDIVKFPKEYLC